jgi:hypothetical protein
MSQRSKIERSFDIDFGSTAFKVEYIYLKFSSFGTITRPRCLLHDDYESSATVKDPVSMAMGTEGRQL